MTDLYNNDNMKMFLLPLSLVDGDKKEIVYISPMHLCRNEFWLRILFPQSYGFMMEEAEFRCDIFNIESVKKFLLVMQDMDIDATMSEKIEISELLHKYGTKKKFIEWNRDNDINIDPDNVDFPDAQIYREWIKKYIDAIHWKSLGIDDLGKSKYDTYLYIIPDLGNDIYAINRR